MARIIVARTGDAPTVWEVNAERRGAKGYAVIKPEQDMVIMV